MHAKAIFVLCLIICCLKLTHSELKDSQKAALYEVFVNEFKELEELEKVNSKLYIEKTGEISNKRLRIWDHLQGFDPKTEVHVKYDAKTIAEDNAYLKEIAKKANKILRENNPQLRYEDEISLPLLVPTSAKNVTEEIANLKEVEEIDQPMNYEKQPDTDASEGANVKKEDDVAQDKNEQPNAPEKKRKSNCLSKLLCGRHKE
ncbi:uncharacterized protein LOC126836884 isoform X3 [Adelges cooleyi]|uniref:uncharacterized protein LOC126836884 isoform X1 n=1 Tax=Adelges cooleyi TaxID=133065 RepID=UPI002180779C|nr:uncharacterized protein LOC126836884 isoform X1 [Adelges cooleyi]XP_050426515.1 uncharacterized protein LOC126836884 isoform X2 [Adelges cooleyi]XP_050426516.1 uncharacterized protein LOC126836884 isoform X3 [Adelges cooleyi]